MSDAILFQMRKTQWYGRCECGWIVGAGWSALSAQRALDRHRTSRTHNNPALSVRLGSGWPDPEKAQKVVPDGSIQDRRFTITRSSR